MPNDAVDPLLGLALDVWVEAHGQDKRQHGARRGVNTGTNEVSSQLRDLNLSETMLFVFSQQLLGEVVLRCFPSLNGQGIEVLVRGTGKFSQLVRKWIQPRRNRSKDRNGFSVCLARKAEVGTPEKCLGNFEDIVGFTADPSAPGNDRHDGDGDSHRALDESFSAAQAVVHKDLGLVRLYGPVCLSDLGVGSRVLRVESVSNLLEPLSAETYCEPAV